MDSKVHETQYVLMNVKEIGETKGDEYYIMVESITPSNFSKLEYQYTNDQNQLSTFSDKQKPHKKKTTELMGKKTVSENYRIKKSSDTFLVLSLRFKGEITVESQEKESNSATKLILIIVGVFVGIVIIIIIIYCIRRAAVKKTAVAGAAAAVPVSQAGMGGYPAGQYGAGYPMSNQQMMGAQYSSVGQTGAYSQGQPMQMGMQGYQGQQVNYGQTSGYPAALSYDPSQNQGLNQWGQRQK